MPLGRLRSVCVLIWQRTLWPDSPAIPNGGWMCSTISANPFFGVRLLAESLEEAAGFKTVSAVTPASG